MPSKKKGRPPGIQAHAAHIRTDSSSRDALFESTEVLDTFLVGTVRFGDLGGVEEGGEPSQTFEKTSDSEESFDKISDSVTRNVQDVTESCRLEVGG